MRNVTFCLAFTFVLLSACDEQVTNNSSDNCGDNLVDFNEECDGYDMGGFSCQTEGFHTGDLACFSDCTLDTSGCSMYCGDGELQAGFEECEYNDLNETTCQDVGFSGGELSCATDCTFDTSQCVAKCGDGVIEAAVEDCEGSDLSGETCASLGYYGGVLSCDDGCHFDLTSCQQAGRCGDGQIQGEEGEACDGSALAGESCFSQSDDGSRYGSGLACNSECGFDLSGCGYCGDGIVHDGFGESCDGTNLLGATCASVTGQSESQGTLACDSDCGFDLSGCGYCGDGVAQGAELCDGSDLAGANCTDVGLLHGMPTCTDCTLSYEACHTTLIFGTGGNDEGRDLFVNQAGQVFVTGYTEGTLGGGSNSGGEDVFLSRIDPLSGVVVSTTFGNEHENYGIGITGNDLSVNVSGHGIEGFDSGATGTALDGAVQTFQQTSLLSSAYFEISTALEDNATGITREGTALYVTGYTAGTLPLQTSSGSKDIFVTKYSETGSVEWTTQFGSSFDDKGAQLIHDGAGSLYVCGEAGGTVSGQPYAGGGSDILVAKLNASTGALVWVRLYGSPYVDKAYGLTLDAAGDLYVTGAAGGSINGATFHGGMDAFVMKLGTDGTHRWTNLYGSAIAGWGMGLIAENGLITVAGTVSGGVSLEGEALYGGYDIFFVTVTADGLLVGAKVVGTTADESCFAFRREGNGNHAVVGYTTGSMDGNAVAGGKDVLYYSIYPME